MLILRCGSWPELQGWKKALECCAKTKLEGQHFELAQDKVYATANKTSGLLGNSTKTIKNGAIVFACGKAMSIEDLSETLIASNFSVVDVQMCLKRNECK